MKILAKKLTNKVPIFINADDFAKCSTCSIRAPRRPYGQNGDFSDLPVKSSPQLRAKCRFLGFARKIGPQTLFAYVLCPSQQELVMHTQKPG